MRTWPSWHPGQELKAEHLLGLEDFLLARTILLEGGCHGVEDFDETSSLKVTLLGSVLEISVQSLRGVTPGGHPILLEGVDLLKTQVSLVGPGSLIFDLTVEINHPDEDAKLVLKAVAVGDLPQTPPSGPRPPLRLELGRYRWLSDGSVEMLRRPLVRRLGALQPYDAAWRLWVEPFESSIQTMLQELEREKPPFSLAVLAWSNELQRFAFEWPTLALPELIRRLRLIQWLRLPPKERPPLPETLPLLPWTLPEDATGDELPERLAEVLGPREKKAPVSESGRRLKLGDEVICTWVDRFWEARFVHPYSGGTVELHIPTQANPPQSMSVQNRELTYVRSVDGDLKGHMMVYDLGALPIKAGSVFRFRLSKVVPAGLNDAEFHFLKSDKDA